MVYSLPSYQSLYLNNHYNTLIYYRGIMRVILPGFAKWKYHAKAFHKDSLYRHR
jgi:hypothetical protein